MKREALSHPKMLDLATRLNCSLAQAIGHVTLLINWVSDFAICGDVGKWPDGAIARGCGWTTADTTEATTVVTALVESGWLDRHPEHRLILHDWPDHAERWVRAKLAATGQQFLECYAKTNTEATTEATTVETAEPTTVATPPRDRTEPNQTKPLRDVLPASPVTGDPKSSSQNKKSKGVPASDVRRQMSRDDDAQKFLVSEEELPAIMRKAATIAKVCKPADINRNRAQHMADRSLIFKAVVIAERRLSEDWLWDSVEAVRVGKTSKTKCAHFHAVLASKCDELNEDFAALLRRVDNQQSVLNPLTYLSQE